MDYLSPHFKLSELTKSDTAARMGIKNTPNSQHISALVKLCENVLEPIRIHFNRPVHISSGYRCPLLNATLKGSKNSQHTKGQAADIFVRGVPNVTIYNYIVSALNYDQVIAEFLKEGDGDAGWIHVSYVGRNSNRKSQMSCVAPGMYVPGLVYAV